MGYAFDGFPIYGPYGYDHSNIVNYNSDENRDTSCAIKLMLSSYTETPDSLGNPTYLQRLKDLETGVNTEYLDILTVDLVKLPNIQMEYIIIILLLMLMI